MRTTVTLDEDVERLLRDAMQRDRKSFKESLNQALRMGLAAGRPAAEPFVVRPWRLGAFAGDASRLNQLADELEVQAKLERMGRAAAAERRRQGRLGAHAARASR